VNDTNFVRFGESVGNLRRKGDRFAKWNRARGERPSQRLAIHQFHGNVTCAVHMPQLINRDDVGMIERAGGTGFPFKACQGFRLSKAFHGKRLNGDFTVEAGVSGAVHLAHAPGAQLLKDLVIPKERAR
jgi:hypothetical protein